MRCRFLYFSRLFWCNIHASSHRYFLSNNRPLTVTTAQFTLVTYLVNLWRTSLEMFLFVLSEESPQNSHPIAALINHFLSWGCFSPGKIGRLHKEKGIYDEHGCHAILQQTAIPSCWLGTSLSSGRTTTPNLPQGSVQETACGTTKRTGSSEDYGLAILVPGPELVWTATEKAGQEGLRKLPPKPGVKSLLSEVTKRF